ncbi:MAG TPA: hypothetical protein VMM18_10500 [Gemmatimonadaceae bacterium]|nr:hypothetical protein [Gemmatimonadaceae bacterium]
MRRARWLIVLAIAMITMPLAAAQAQRTGAEPPPPAARNDSAFRALQARGANVMGVDQYTSVHRFDTLHDGGRIVLQRIEEDSAGTQTIRQHLRAIADAFGRGDFSMSREVHGMDVPGAAVLAERRAHITYEVRDVARGAELRIRTTDAAALKALRAFMEFQNADHRTGHRHHD